LNYDEGKLVPQFRTIEITYEEVEKAKQSPKDAYEVIIAFQSKERNEKIGKKSGGDIRKLEELLGLNRGDLGEAPVRVDIPEPTGLRMPSGNEPGANEFWLPGGYTSGGLPEAVIDQVPINNAIVSRIYN
jgi:hypothetical protein